jgi:hypothetical protein
MVGILCQTLDCTTRLSGFCLLAGLAVEVPIIVFVGALQYPANRRLRTGRTANPPGDHLGIGIAKPSYKAYRRFLGLLGWQCVGN